MADFYKISNKIQNLITSILGRCSAFLMIAVTLFALAEIIRRYVFGVVFEWGQDAVIYMMVSSVAFYICVTQINRNHLVMSAVLQLLNAKGFHRTVGFCKIFISFFVSLFTGSLTFTAYSTIEYFKFAMIAGIKSGFIIEKFVKIQNLSTPAERTSIVIFDEFMLQTDRPGHSSIRA